MNEQDFGAKDAKVSSFSTAGVDINMVGMICVELGEDGQELAVRQSIVGGGNEMDGSEIIRNSFPHFCCCLFDRSECSMNWAATTRNKQFLRLSTMLG